MNDTELYPIPVNYVSAPSDRSEEFAHWMRTERESIYTGNYIHELVQKFLSNLYCEKFKDRKKLLLL